MGWVLNFNCFYQISSNKNTKIHLHDYDIPTPSGGDEGDLYAKERQLTDSSCQLQCQIQVEQMPPNLN